MFVYIIRVPGTSQFKFGVSSNISSRLETYQTALCSFSYMVFPCEHARDVEARLKQALRDRGSLMKLMFSGSDSECSDTGPDDCHLLFAIQFVYKAILEPPEPEPEPEPDSDVSEGSDAASAVWESSDDSEGSSGRDLPEPVLGLSSDHHIAQLFMKDHWDGDMKWIQSKKTWVDRVDGRIQLYAEDVGNMKLSSKLTGPFLAFLEACVDDPARKKELPLLNKAIWCVSSVIGRKRILAEVKTARMIDGSEEFRELAETVDEHLREENEVRRELEKRKREEERIEKQRAQENTIYKDDIKKVNDWMKEHIVVTGNRKDYVLRDTILKKIDESIDFHSTPTQILKKAIQCYLQLVSVKYKHMGGKIKINGRFMGQAHIAYGVKLFRR